MKPIALRLGSGKKQWLFGVLLEKGRQVSRSSLNCRELATLRVRTKGLQSAALLIGMWGGVLKCKKMGTL